MKISVVIKDPGKKPRHVAIENSLKNLQKTVDGYIEVVRIASDLAVIVNEEGLIRDLPYNFNCMGHALFGTAIFVGVNGEEFCDLPLSFREMKNVFPILWAEV